MMQQPTSGQCTVLSWLKEHDLLGPIQDLWNAACHCEGLDALDCLVNNGYSVDPDAIIMFSSMAASVMIIETFCFGQEREHGIEWDVMTWQKAVFHDDLPMLQWLRENDSPWDFTVIVHARIRDREDIAQWAIDNGCPTEPMLLLLLEQKTKRQSTFVRIFSIEGYRYNQPTYRAS